MIELTPNVRRFLGLDEFDAQQSAAPPDEISASVTPVDSSQWDAASVPTAGAGGQSWAPPAAEPQYDPRDADQGARETGPAPWTPLSPNTPEPTYQIADGRTAPPTPNGNWEEVRTIPKPQPVAEEPPQDEGWLPRTARNVGNTIGEAAQAGGKAWLESVTSMPSAADLVQNPYFDPIMGQSVRAGQAAQAAASDVIGRRFFQGVGGNVDEELIEVNIPGVGPVKLTKGDVAGLLFQMGLDPSNIVGAGQAPNVARAAAPVVREAGQAAGRAGRALAEEAAQRGRGMLDNAPRAGGAPGEVQLGSGFVPEESRRFYHGTADAFGRPDPEKFDPNGLYGPGYYLTSEPRVANSYAEARTPIKVSEFEDLTEEAADLRALLDGRSPWSNDPKQRAFAERRLPEIDRELASLNLDDIASGPNVRAVDVPSSVRLLEADSTIPVAELQQIEQAVARIDSRSAADFRASMEGSVKQGRKWVASGEYQTDATGQRLYEVLDRVVKGHFGRASDSRGVMESKAVVNRILQDAGYDGLGHMGGRITPLLDDAGKPIEHTVNVIFERGLPKIRNGFSGEVGGSGFVPQMSDLRNAAQGGVVGAMSEQFSDEELTPEERLRRIGTGAALGVAAGRFARGRGAASARRLGSGMVPEGEAQRAARLSLDDADSVVKFLAIRHDALNGPGVAERLAGMTPDELRQTFRQWHAQGVFPEMPDARAFDDEVSSALAAAERDAAGRMVDPSMERAGYGRRATGDDADASPMSGTAAENRRFGDDGYTDRFDPDAPVAPEIPRTVDDAPRDNSFSLNAINPASGAAAGAAGADATGDENLTPEERAQRAAMGAVIGAVVGRKGVAGARRFASDADALNAARGAIKTPEPVAPGAGLSRIEALRRWVVRNATDNRVDINELQREAQRLLGRPLQADEMLAELSRANPSGAGKVMIDEAIKPVAQAAEQAGERENLSTLMMLLNNIDVAAATGNPNRLFSGGLTAADSQAAAEALWRSLPPDKQRLLGTLGDRLQTVVGHYRDEMVRAGVWTPELAADLAEKYPNWIPTKIVEYMADPATMSSGVKGISLRDRGLRQYTIDGTTKAREDPIASLIRYVQEAEIIVQKNEVFNAFANLRERVPGWADLIKEVPTGTPAARGAGQRTVTGFVNGERKTFLVPAPMAAAIQMEQGTQVPILRQLTQVFREFITRTPLFVAGQIPLDAAAYTVRQSAREGGPLAAPGVVGELVRGYAEAFRGLLSGEFRGDAARYLREGGAMAGYYERAANAATQTLDDLTRRNMFEVRNARDARKLAGWMLGGGWVQAFGERVEMAPRVAAFRQGERRALRAGASAETAALQGMIEGRDVTLDFQRGGVAAKIMNQIVPFFNVGVQSSATLPRAFRQNPAAFTTTALSLVAAPAMMAEAWNRMDEQRSRDYDDVPQYVKDRGIVIMLPGVEGRDERGDRRPNYVMIPLRELSPIAILARDLMLGAMNKSERGPMETARAILGAASPVQANGVADLVGSFVPPGASTALQLATDRDFFRGGPIATDRADENASALATGAVGASNALTGRQDRPSQMDFAIRDMFGGVGQMASSASNALTGKQKDEQRIQSTPVVGGLINRFVGDAVGNRLTKAQDEDTRVPAGIRKVLEDAGVRNVDVKPVPSKYQGAELSRAEQVRWQNATNRMIVQYIRDARNQSDWSEKGKREAVVQRLISQAKQDAASQVLTFDVQQRVEQQERRKQRRAS